MKKIVNFYDTGSIKEIGEENEDGKQGKWLYYNDKGLLFIEQSYKDDKDEGELIRYYDNGVIAVKAFYHEGMLDGKGFEYYESGLLKHEWLYKNGEYIPINYWDENGTQLMKDGTGKLIFEYEFGKQADKYKIAEKYYENGNFIKEVIIKDDQLAFLFPIVKKIQLD